MPIIVKMFLHLFLAFKFKISNCYKKTLLACVCISYLFSLQLLAILKTPFMPAIRLSLFKVVYELRFLLFTDALHFISEAELLVKKPLMKWSNDDVCQWLSDLGLGAYQSHFVEQKINGPMLSAMKHSDLELMFNMSFPLHQRTFMQALNYTLTYGVKLPTNLWEYKALYSGYTTFLMASAEVTPRLGLLYVYLYDREGYTFYKESVLSCNCSEAGSVGKASRFLFYAGSMIAPSFVQAKFVYCFTDLHYWTSRFLLIQCLCKGLLDLIYLSSYISFQQRQKILPRFVVEPLKIFTFYYVASWVWWLVPVIIVDALFYCRVYFGSLAYAKDLYKRLSTA